jgi:hypothetical protein
MAQCSLILRLHYRTAIPPELGTDQPLRLKNAKGFPHRAPAQACLLDEVAFPGQHFAGGKFARQNLLTQYFRQSAISIGHPDPVEAFHVGV